MTSTVNLYDIIEQSAHAGIRQQGADGAMPSGHNGPHGDPETPVRSTSHWLITFLKAYAISGSPAFQDAARKAAAYLCSDVARPMHAAFWHRSNPEKNFSNGLIGQAWTLEALAAAADVLGNETCARLAEEVFLLHPFVERFGLWCKLNVEGSHSGLDLTFNHQLWFAAAGSLLPSRDARVLERVQRFLDRLPQSLSLYPSGLIWHLLKSPAKLQSHLKRSVYGIASRVRPTPHQDLYERALGYHAFNLYAFALLRQQVPEHPFWRSDQMARALAYARSAEFVAALDTNKYSYSYNPVGFEVAFALAGFACGERVEQESWVSEQLRRCYDLSAQLLCANSGDSATLAARLYEATRLPDLTVRV